MRSHAARITGLVMGLASMLLLSACAGTQAQNTQQTAQAERSTEGSDAAAAQANAAERDDEPTAGEQVRSAAAATVRETGEAIETVAQTLTGTKDPEARENAQKQRARNLDQVTDAAESIGIGGGPVESETLAIIDSIDASAQRYKKPVDDAGDKISAATRLRYEQIQDNAKDLRKQYDKMKEESDMDIEALDDEYKASAEQLKNSWDNVAQNLSRELQKAEETQD